MIMASWWSAKPRARFHVPSSTSRAVRTFPRPVRPNNSRGDHVTGGITDPDTAEVDDRAEPAAVNEHVGPQQVGVDTHRCSYPRRCLECAFPGDVGRITVYDA